MLRKSISWLLYRVVKARYEDAGSACIQIFYYPLGALSAALLPASAATVSLSFPTAKIGIQTELKFQSTAKTPVRKGQDHEFIGNEPV